MQPFINTSLLHPLARFSFALRLGEAPPSTFLSTASTLSYLALSRNNVDSLTSFADTDALECLGRKKKADMAPFVFRFARGSVNSAPVYAQVPNRSL